MKRIWIPFLIIAVCAVSHSDASARFRLWEVRAVAGMSITTVNQYSVEHIGDEFESIVSETEETLNGIPVGLRFVLAAGEEGPALFLNGYFQPVLADNESVEYLVTPSIWGAGTIERSYWDVGGSAELVYRLERPFRGLYFGAGVGIHRITDKTTFTPALYLNTDFPLPIDLLDNGDFRAGVHLLAGLPLHPRVALEGRYERINDFNQIKVGLSIGLWSYQ